MSNVAKKQRNKHRFTTLDVLLDMYEHTTNVTANPNIFDKKFRGLVDKIDNEAMMIYHLCRSANEDYDNRIKDEAEIRIEMQREALKRCKWLKSYIGLAKKRFHLRARKVIFWNGKVNDAMEAIKVWNQAEIRDYRNNHGL